MVKKQTPSEKNRQKNISESAGIGPKYSFILAEVAIEQTSHDTIAGKKRNPSLHSTGDFQRRATIKKKKIYSFQFCL